MAGGGRRGRRGRTRHTWSPWARLCATCGINACQRASSRGSPQGGTVWRGTACLGKSPRVCIVLGKPGAWVCGDQEQGLGAAVCHVGRGLVRVPPLPRPLSANPQGGARGSEASCFVQGQMAANRSVGASHRVLLRTGGFPGGFLLPAAPPAVTLCSEGGRDLIWLRASGAHASSRRLREINPQPWDQLGGYRTGNPRYSRRAEKA